MSRYNFDELSRILTDRVGNESRAPDAPIELDLPIEPIRPVVASVAVAEGALINIAAETLFSIACHWASSSFGSSRSCLPTVH